MSQERDLDIGMDKERLAYTIYRRINKEYVEYICRS